MSKSFTKTSIALLVCSFSSLYAQAEQANQNIEKAAGSANLLPEIVVYANQNKGLSSIASVTNNDMKKMPAGNGNISDYLRSNPHIRYEHSDQDGFQRGEIKPENISINGADANQTAYFVDNVNVNNDLTVDSEIFDGSMQVLPGISHTQAYFFDASMLSKVETNDSNISASLGGFMGGAVVAKTKQYNGTDGVKLKYRTTHSAWAKMKQDSAAKKVLEKVRPSGDQAALQPKYKKQAFSIMAEKGLTDNLGLAVGFSHRGSKIEQNRLIGTNENATLDKQDHERHSDNLLLNLNWTPTEDDRFELSTRYSDYREKKYYDVNVDTNVADYHKAYGTTLAWVHQFNAGIWTNTLAYDKFEDSRKSSSSNVEIVAVYDDDDEVLYDYEKGGFGNSKLTQKNIHFSTEYAINPFDLSATNHSISFGGIYQKTTYGFHRPQDVHATQLSKYSWGDLPNESITPKGNAKVKYQNFVIYAEDLIKWKNIELRPGIRIERDDYLKNNNIAPRFVARYKPWEDTGLTLGLNRYYGRSFSSLKLTQEILKINQDTSRKYQQFSSLKTPYANESSLGLEQNLGNFAFKANYIYRNNHNRIVLRRDQTSQNNYYDNGNDFSVNIYSLQVNNIEPWELGKTFWNTSLGFDWLNTKRADLGREYDPLEPVYLNGKLMTRQQMQQKVNSSTEDWIARLGLDMLVPDYNVTWSNKVYIKSPIKGYEEIYGDFNDDISRFRTYDYGTHTQWDSSIRWQPKIIGKHSVYIQADILNVLNKTRKIKNHKAISSSNEYGTYTPGREFWLQVGYEF